MTARGSRADALIYTHKGASANAGGTLVHHAVALDGAAERSPPRLFETTGWPSESGKYRKGLADRLGRVGASRSEDRSDALLQIRSIAAAAGKRLIPAEMARWLWRVHDHARTLGRDAPTLLLQCTEPNIPWELLWLRDPDDARPGQFLAETFALSHWITPHDFSSSFPLRNIGLVVPNNARSIFGPEERRSILELEDSDRRVTVVPARMRSILKGMHQAVFDGWHLVGHGRVDSIDPEASEYILERPGVLTPSVLEELVRSLEPARPLVFANFCDSGRREEGLTGTGGLAEAFLKLGCGAYLGTLWPVDGKAASTFAPLFYRTFISGVPLAEAVRRSRIALRKKLPGDPAWLAYVLYGPPVALCHRARGAEIRPLYRESPDETQRRLGPSSNRQPTLPAYVWKPGVSAPSALLRPEYGVVPFHGRGRELGELAQWVSEEDELSVQHLLGVRGVGKTRLALELCERMRPTGWDAGFLIPLPGTPPGRLVDLLERRKGDLLIVLDDPETRSRFLPLLLGSERSWTGRRLRILVLAGPDSFPDGRSTPDGVRHLTRTLGPFGKTTNMRRSSFLIAGGAFAERLGHAPPIEAPGDVLSFREATPLLLHLHALAATLNPAGARDDDPMHVLATEEARFWRRQGAHHGLPDAVAAEIGSAMLRISAVGGAVNATHSRKVLSEVDALADQPSSALARLARFLHGGYGGRRWIDPLMGQLAEHFREGRTRVVP